MRILLSIGLVLLLACNPKPQPSPANVPEPQGQGPAWVIRGPTHEVREGKRVFVGVGAAGNIKNVALLQATADNRARAEIAKLVETYTASLMKDYMQSLAGAAQTSEEQHVGHAIKTMSAVTLSGVEIVERHHDKTTGVMYSRSELPLDDMTARVLKTKDFSDGLKTYVSARAGDGFDRIGNDEESRRQTPGMCRQRLRVASLDRSRDDCQIAVATELPLVIFPCTGGDITWFFGDVALEGHVGTAGSISLEGTPPPRVEAGCTWKPRVTISGQLKGEILFDYQEVGTEAACKESCAGQAKVLTVSP